MIRIFFRSAYFKPHLQRIRNSLGLEYTDEKLLEDHRHFFDILSLKENQKKYADYWMKKVKTMEVWDPLGVIESYQFEPHGLHKGRKEWAYLLSRVGIEKLSQACTERIVKLLRKIEPRFAGFNETKLALGKRDRCAQEVFLCDNKIALNKLPLRSYERFWNKSVVKIDRRSRDDTLGFDI